MPPDPDPTIETDQRASDEETVDTGQIRAPDPDASPATGPALTELLDARYDEVCFLTRHNAYQNDAPPDADGFDDFFDRLYGLGIRGLELDFVASDTHWAWSIGHDSYSSARMRQLDAYLMALLRWSIRREPHEPIELHLDCKDAVDDRLPDRFDSYIAESFAADRIFKPGDLVGSDLRFVDEASRGGRWPTIRQLQTRFLFCISGDGDVSRAYAASNIANPGRLCFCDRPLQPPSDPIEHHDANRVIVNLQAIQEPWKRTLADLKSAPWILPRTYVVQNEAFLEAAVTGGAWAIATDKADLLTARTGNTPFLRRSQPLP